MNGLYVACGAAALAALAATGSGMALAWTMEHEDRIQHLENRHNRIYAQLLDKIGQDGANAWGHIQGTLRNLTNEVGNNRERLEKLESETRAGRGLHVTAGGGGAGGGEGGAGGGGGGGDSAVATVGTA